MWTTGGTKIASTLDVIATQLPVVDRRHVGRVVVECPIHFAQSLGYRSTRSRPDHPVVNLAHRHDSARRRGHEHLVGAAQIISLELAEFRFDIGVLTQLDHCAAGNAFQYAAIGDGSAGSSL